MTSGGGARELRILGPLEVRLDGEPLALGGAKQRAVLGLLLLRAGEVVPIEALVDDLWGDDPPASAAHTIEAYVSRLRQRLAHGPALVRRGAGYVLELGDASYDARRFADLHAAGARAAADGDHERQSQLTSEAIAVWRGPVLADVALGRCARAEADRLDELLLRTLELRADAELALGRHEELVGELQVLVRQHPFRERFVAQLMLALYRSGRHADALAVYERTRGALADELGLQPSAELQQLSGRIVRQEESLDMQARETPSTRRPAAARRTRPRASLVISGAVAVAGAVLVASGSAPRPAGAADDPSTTRIAVVLPRAPAADPVDLMARYERRLAVTGHWYRETERRIIVAAGANADPAVLESRVRREGFDLVLWVGDGEAAKAFAPRVAGLGETRFVFLDGSLSTLGLEGVANASAVRFTDEQASEISGYLGGLMGSREHSGLERADVVSVVAAARTPRTERMVARFERGLRRAAPNAELLVGYAGGQDDPTRCESVANEQIDKGSDVLLVVSGSCGQGALAVAELRGVWAVDADNVLGELRGHVLMRMFKQYERAFDLGVDAFFENQLPAGRDITFGIEDDYAVSMELGLGIPAAIESKAVALCSSIRQHAVRDDL